MGSAVSRDLLKRVQRKLKEVERLEFQSGLDSEGEPATWIWVVFKADAPEKTWSWENRQRIRSFVKDELDKADVTDWAYVRFRSADEEAPSTSVSST